MSIEEKLTSLASRYEANITDVMKVEKLAEKQSKELDLAIREKEKGRS